MRRPNRSSNSPAERQHEQPDDRRHPDHAEWYFAASEQHYKELLRLLFGPDVGNVNQDGSS